MKILLIAPRTNRRQALFSPPLNLGYLKSYLLKYGPYRDVKVIDESAIDYDVCEFLKQYKPDIIGSTCLSDTRINCFKMLESARKILPQAKIIVGGTHATLMYKQILGHYSFVDYVCVGEGEQTLLEFVRTLDKGGDLSRVKGLAMRLDGKVYFTGTRDFIKDLETIPFPDYDDINLLAYKGSRLYPWERNMTRASILSSRGCPFSCIFCGSREAFPGWRARRVDSVVEEFRWYVDKFKFGCFSIVDDLFSLNEERAIEICRRLLSLNLDIKWFAQTRADALTEELARVMKKSGCQILQIGAESGSPQILKTINKNETLETIENAFSICNRVGLRTQMNLILGAPGENQETVKETNRLIKRFKPFITQISILQVFPRTQICEDFKVRNNLSDDMWLSETEGYDYNYLSREEFNKYTRQLQFAAEQARGFAGYCAMISRFGRYYWFKFRDYLAGKPQLNNFYSLVKQLKKRVENFIPTLQSRPDGTVGADGVGRDSAQRGKKQGTPGFGPGGAPFIK